MAQRPGRPNSRGDVRRVCLARAGRVLVRTPGRSNFRPAHVDPKAFFAPGRTNWTAQERISAYGTEDYLAVADGLSGFQSDYAAIVLLNPSTDSGPLELSATVRPDTPRRVTFVDPEGKPVLGVETRGLRRPRTSEPPLHPRPSL